MRSHPAAFGFAVVAESAEHLAKVIAGVGRGCRRVVEVECAGIVAVSESDLQRRLEQTSREVERLRAE